MNHFIFKIGEEVILDLSDENGRIKGRAEHEHGENQYLVIYRAADNRQTECWWGESDIRQN
jgi:hypothetical protein